MTDLSCSPRISSALFGGLAGCISLALSACSASPTARHLVTDQNAMLEAGRSMGLAEYAVRLTGRYGQGGNSEQWSALLFQAGELSVAAGRVAMSRTAAVCGSDSEAERYYAGLDAATAALREQRETLADELAKALPGADSKVAASSRSR
jgi:hypothetical protein